MTDLAAVEVVLDGDEQATVRLTGEIDTSNADRLLHVLQGALVRPVLTIDLSRVEYLDSAGVRMLYRIAEAGGARGTAVTLVVPPASPVRRVLAYSGVDGVLSVLEPA